MTAGRTARLLLAAALAAAPGGCRLFKSSDSGGGPSSRGNDPLLGRYIPKTNLPVSDRDAAGRGRDPLYSTPAGRDKGGDREKDEPSARADREPYRPGIETTVAGLAAGRADDTSLSIGERPDRRSGGATAGRGPVPLTAPGVESVAAELRRLGATVTEPVREGGEYVMRADVAPPDGGRVRRYEGAGGTPAAAARQLLDQVREDAK
jgi:hypothetical protein